MSLSAHRRLALTAAVGAGPERIEVMRDCVAIQYPGLRVLVRRVSWSVFHPDDEEEAALLTALGVGERARRAVETGEGQWRPEAYGVVARAAEAAMKRRMACA